MQYSNMVIQAALVKAEPVIIDSRVVQVKGRTLMFLHGIRRVELFGQNYERDTFYDCFRQDDESRRCFATGHNWSLEDFQDEVKADPKFYGL